MAFFIRKILEKTACLNCSSPKNCPHECDDYKSFIPPLVHPPPAVVTTEYKYHMPVYFILMLGVLGAAFVLICYMIILKRNRSNSRTRRNIDPQLNETREDFIDENLGPVVDHPIWYIRTVGLPQEIIDSIAVFQYKKGEALVEGTDCSVCLTEFEEDESLRLLPKCSHAFHVPCIDTWLRSHKNCPLCRAPIVSNVPQVSNVLEVAIANRGDESSSSEVDQVENGMRNDQLENVEEGNHETRHGVENLEDLRTDEERMMDLSMKIPRLVEERTKGVRVFSDLNDLRVKVENELQPSRRSVSMDSSAAAQVILGNIEGCSSSSDQQGKRKSLEIVTKKGNSNSSLYKAMKSSSFGRSLQKVPISMKRSFSTNAKWSSLPTTSKIQDLRQSM